MVCEVAGEKVKLGIKAHKDVIADRMEIAESRHRMTAQQIRTAIEQGKEIY